MATTTPSPQDRQVARAKAESRAERPTWREAAAWGAIFGVVLGLLAVFDPVPSLGSVAPPAARTVVATVRLVVVDALIGAALFSIGGFLIRALRKALLAFQKPEQEGREEA